MLTFQIGLLKLILYSNSNKLDREVVRWINNNNNCSLMHSAFSSYSFLRSRFSIIVQNILTFCIFIVPKCYIFYVQKRHRADREVNHRKIETLRNGQWNWLKWKELVVGDVVKVLNNNFFPADLIILSSRSVFVIGPTKQ